MADWDDYAAFAQVARHGALAGAAATLGVSQATLSRRMRAFEARLGRRLFVHGPAGYALTADGRALHARTQRMEAAAVDIDLWRAAGEGPVPVRISAGTWTALHIAEHMREIWRAGDPWIPELVHCERSMDLARREIDIGMRNARPTQPWLAGRRVGHTEFAVFGASREIMGWIGMAPEVAFTPSARWIEETNGTKIVTRTNAPLFAYQLACAGVGRTVLPLSVGDGAPGLQRLSEPIDELTAEQWLVSHVDARHDPPIRAALEALATFFRDDAKRQAAQAEAAATP